MWSPDAVCYIQVHRQLFPFTYSKVKVLRRVLNGCAVSSRSSLFFFAAHCAPNSVIQKEKFLIIWTLIGQEMKQPQLTDFWKTVPSSVLYEHRCVLICDSFKSTDLSLLLQTEMFICNEISFPSVCHDSARWKCSAVSFNRCAGSHFRRAAEIGKAKNVVLCSSFELVIDVLGQRFDRSARDVSTAHDRWLRSTSPIHLDYFSSDSSDFSVGSFQDVCFISFVAFSCSQFGVVRRRWREMSSFIPFFFFSFRSMFLVLLFAHGASRRKRKAIEHNGNKTRSHRSTKISWPTNEENVSLPSSSFALIQLTLIRSLTIEKANRPFNCFWRRFLVRMKRDRRTRQDSFPLSIERGEGKKEVRCISISIVKCFSLTSKANRSISFELFLWKRERAMHSARRRERKNASARSSCIKTTFGRQRGFSFSSAVKTKKFTRQRWEWKIKDVTIESGGDNLRGQKQTHTLVVSDRNLQ